VEHKDVKILFTKCYKRDITSDYMN